MVRNSDILAISVATAGGVLDTLAPAPWLAEDATGPDKHKQCTQGGCGIGRPTLGFWD